MKNAFIILMTLVSTTIFSLDEYIGLTPSEVVENFGAPDVVYSERGLEEHEDDVIFFYNNRVYAYFNNNRVWQLRVDSLYESLLEGIGIGSSSSAVKDALGEAYKVYEDSAVYRRPDAGFPIYLRVYYLNDKVSDLYLFRGDF